MAPRSYVRLPRHAAIIKTRLVDGLQRIGRPLGKNAPAPERVAALRAAGRTWTAIARRLRCTPSSARRAFARGLSKTGSRRTTPATVEKRAA